MEVDGVPYRTIWVAEDRASVCVIDQTRLPHAFEVLRLSTCEDVERAIGTMVVRGAPLIGATAAYGMWLAARRDPSDAALAAAARRLLATRPTAVNLRWAIDEMTRRLRGLDAAARAEAALREAEAIADADVATNLAIGGHGFPLLRREKDVVRVMTHCNAGWLATVDGGTALAPVYRAVKEGIAVHVWVSETRPRGQGSSLTAWELGRAGVPHTLVADSACGHLLQRGEVDLVIVGADRVTASGDVANKIGTYLKALAAREAGVPFHVAAPSSTVDWNLSDGLAIAIEERSEREVTHVSGRLADGRVVEVDTAPAGTAARNPAFDVTPSRWVTSLVTERGVCPATSEGLSALFPRRAPPVA